MSIQPEATYDDYDAPDACLRCAGIPGAPAGCIACIGEVAAARERDQGAAATLASLRGMFDPMTGRPDTSGWGW